VARPAIARLPGDVRTLLGEARAKHARIGFVPTMGYLHEGHASLVRAARAACDVVVVSIFVNPLQFGPAEDFATYPRDFDRDVALLRAEDADIVFAPEAAALYPEGPATFIEVGGVTEMLEGAMRPGHFRGVATIVTILLDIVAPVAAYFGEKDWQQLQVVRKLVRDLHLPVEIVGVPTRREADGLAMSSRNVRLSPDARRQALCIPRALDAARAAYASGERAPAVLERCMRDVMSREPGVAVDYAVVVDGTTMQPVSAASDASRALIAARAGGVRLIDNSSLQLDGHPFTHAVHEP
jgi:pantoate--beta-alanine ligase